MKTDRLYSELEDLLTSYGIEIRKEKGNFKSDSCTVEGKKYLVLNKLHPIDYQISLLAKVLFDLKMDDQFIKPVVRKELERIWKLSPYGKKKNEEFDLS
jgi:hypothetical protein